MWARVFLANLFVIFWIACCHGFVYFIEQESYSVKDYWTCRGVPALKAQRVMMLEEAIETYYNTLMSGRFSVDRHLDTVVPPHSILQSPIYSKLISMVSDHDETKFGNQLYMKLNCRLFNDQEWVRDVFNRPLSRNTDTVRAILDIIYRVALCLRGVDQHLNCPDVCREKGTDFCSTVPHSTGECSSYLDDTVRTAMPTPDKTYDNSLTLKWFKNIPLSRRLPLITVSKNQTKRFLEMQSMIARTAYCPCTMYYRYDRFLDGCVDMSQDIGCAGTNQCANGGRCVTAMVQNTFESSLVKELVTTKCECPPAFRGEHCEMETDRCVEENACGEFNCVRDPHDQENGYRCICPPTYKRKSPGEPMCVPLPACGERVALDSNGLIISNPSATHQPCMNNGFCAQGEDPTMYTCVCQPGYTGKNCEIEPPAPTWGPWTAWSMCIWPEAYEICYKRPFQQQIRTCITHTPGQRCVGSQRRQRHAGCDLHSGFQESHTGITSLKRKRLKEAAELCELTGRQAQSISEKQLGEQLFSIDAIDDWSTVGLEDAPFLNLPEGIRFGNLQAVNWPRAEDLIFITIWIYAVLLHLALILLWIYHIHRWRAVPLPAPKAY